MSRTPEPIRPDVCPVQGRCEKAPDCVMKPVHTWCARFKELTKQVVTPGK